MRQLSAAYLSANGYSNVTVQRAGEKGITMKVEATEIDPAVSGKIINDIVAKYGAVDVGTKEITSIAPVIGRDLLRRSALALGLALLFTLLYISDPVQVLIRTCDHGGVAARHTGDAGHPRGLPRSAELAVCRGVSCHHHVLGAGQRRHPGPRAREAEVSRQRSRSTSLQMRRSRRRGCVRSIHPSRRSSRWLSCS